jgi:hypothetical protein
MREAKRTNLTRQTRTQEVEMRKKTREKRRKKKERIG